MKILGKNVEVQFKDSMLAQMMQMNMEKVSFKNRGYNQNLEPNVDRVKNETVKVKRVAERIKESQVQSGKTVQDAKDKRQKQYHEVKEHKVDELPERDPSEMRRLREAMILAEVISAPRCRDRHNRRIRRT